MIRVEFVFHFSLFFSIYKKIDPAPRNVFKSFTVKKRVLKKILKNNLDVKIKSWLSWGERNDWRL